ncbi:hypothetical protein B1218_34660 [Pseudomonas ogarae]|nr:hypothetical protein B1218_34660 [Pseudomonas ogarae]
MVAWMVGRGGAGDQYDFRWAGLGLAEVPLFGRDMLGDGGSQARFGRMHGGRHVAMACYS